MTHRRTIAGALVLAAVAATAAWALVRANDAREVHTSSGALVVAKGVQLASRIYVPEGASAKHRVPAVLLAHGLGDDQDDVATTARMLARHGYLVLTWNSRGERGSDGRVGIAAPTGEVADVSALVDALAARDDVQRDGAHDPRVGVVGISHGGGTALLAAAHDHRIDAVVPIFAWGDLRTALEPNAVEGSTATSHGVLKLGWDSVLFAAGTGSRRPDTPCGDLLPELCRDWQSAADTGSFDARAEADLEQRSIVAALQHREYAAPTLFIQGQMDSLFDLGQILPVAEQLRRSSVPTRVEWVRAGHDLAPARETQAHMDAAIRRWLDRYVRKRQSVDTGARFTVQLGAGRGYGNAPTIPPHTSRRFVPVHPVDQTTEGFVRAVVPPRGLPADTTTLPGLGDVTGFADVLATPDGQRARFASGELRNGIEVVGSPRVTLRVRGSNPQGNLFVHLVDIGSADQQVIPRGLVAPLHLTSVPALDAHTARTVTIDLSWIAYRFAPGHRIGLTIATTDAGFDARFVPATWDVAVDGDIELPRASALHRSPETFDAGASPKRLGWYSLAIVLVALLAGIVAMRWGNRRTARVHESHLRDVPIVATALRKRYRGAKRASVDGVDLRVERGAVVGIVGPNGAGKTTIMRMLLGLVRPSSGSAWIFGQRVRAGAPHLARVGALVDGPGLLPHATFAEHLRRFARAAGRPADPASIGAALAAADLVELADQRVRTASHGMRQRLGIAQALLGSPDIVILDEPTNGLDPAQIHHVRSTICELAAAGCTVLVASHVLGELERVCSHVVLLARGRVLGAGTLAQVVGEHEDLEAAFLAAVEADDDR